MNNRMQFLLLTFVALIVALSVKTILADPALPLPHMAIAIGEIAAALLLLSNRFARIAGIRLSIICTGVAILHFAAAAQIRFDLLIYSALALYIGFEPRVQRGATT